MNFIDKQILAKLSGLVASEAPDSDRHTERIRFMERNIGLPVKAVVLGILLYSLFFSRWFDEVTAASAREVAVGTIQRFFLIYLIINVAAGIMLLGMAQLPAMLIQWVVFTVALLDGLFFSCLILLPGGYDSLMFWIIPGLIVRNAISTPFAPWQIVLNLLVTLFFVVAALMDLEIDRFDQVEVEGFADPLVWRFALLFLMTLCCYGVQVLVDRQRRVEEDAREFALRQEQLRVTSRLAAEIAHQLKNPLSIINNAAFNLQRNVKEGKATITQQIRIIREEVERSDRIITDMMGYARLAEGTIEKLSITESLDMALDLVFPAAAHYEVKIQREYAPVLPPLLMQRNHVSEILINLLQNAREAMNGSGTVLVRAQYGEDYSVIVTIEDTGPGIPAELRDKIFEPYFTTREKGTGLGLAIVKHNVEIYGGSVQVESEAGKGARFILHFPAKSYMKLRK